MRTDGVVMFQVNDEVHSSLYKFGKVVSVNTWVTVEWEPSELYRSPGNRTSYTLDGKGALGITAIRKVDNREDFHHETGKYKNWQIEEMDKFYCVRKK
jgi:hypothetical protein